MNTNDNKPLLLNHPEATTLAEEAKTAFTRHDYAHAEQLARRALALWPGSASAHNSLAAIFNDTGRAEEALAELRQAIEAEPDNPIPYCNLAMVLRRHERPEESLLALERLFSHKARDDSRHATVFDRASGLYFDVQQMLARKRQPEVDEALGQLRRSVEELTGYPVCIMAGSPSPAADASLEIAPLSGRDHHLVSCSPDLPPLVRPCAIANELAHIRLEFEAAAAGKARQFFRNSRTRRFMSGFYTKQKGPLRRHGLTSGDIEHAIAEDSGYLVAVLLNRPINLAGESWVRRHVPCLSAAQFLAFHHYQQTLPAPSQILDQASFLRPRSLDVISLALNGVEALIHDAWFAGATSFAKPYRIKDVFPLSEKLWHHWQTVSPLLGVGDEYCLVDAFADLVGLGQAYGSRTYSRQR